MSHRNALLLFADDFDVIRHAPVPVAPALEEPPPLSYGQDDMDSARVAAHAEGYAQGIADAAAADAARVAAAVVTIGEQLADAAANAARVAEEGAEIIARLLLATGLAGYPQLRARHGAGEVRALIQRTLPGLLLEQRATFHVHPSMMQLVADELSAVPFGERQHLTVEPTETVPPGDARITWPHGAAIRDTTKTAAAIADILGPLGLLPDPPDDNTAVEAR